MQRLTLVPLLSALCLGCGNYSNEDIDFQLALPSDGELDAKLPQALSVADASEYYVLTHNVVVSFNSLQAALMGLIDHVRGYSPTSRHGTQRIWGPFRDDKHAGWQLRVVMDRSPDPNNTDAVVFSYQIQVRRAGQEDSAFIDLMTGQYASSGGARLGTGHMDLTTGKARDAGYPADDPNDPNDLNDLAEIHTSYQTGVYPVQVSMQIINQATSKEREINYSYSEEADGSGAMVFHVTVDRTISPNDTDLEVTSRWLGSGAGRADARTPTRSATATDCWGIDTRASYVFRSWMSPPVSSGFASNCVFADPQP